MPSLLLLCVGFISTFIYGANPSSLRYSNIAVHFDPYVSVRDITHKDNYDSVGLLPMIRKISTRFNKITTYISPDDIKYARSKTLIPSAVATFNKYHKKPNAPNLELSISVSFSSDEFKSYLNLVKELADNANKIFNRTVIKFVLFQDILSENELQSHADKLDYAQAIINNSEYELGFSFDTKICKTKDESSATYLPLILHRVHKHVYFYLAVAPKHLDGFYYANKVKNDFQICKEKFNKFNGKMSFGLISGWRYSYQNYDYEKIENMRELVTFWDTIRDFATENNLCLVMLDAFDSPSKGATRHNGWWRFEESASYYNSSQYIFEEKAEIIREENLTYTNNKMETNHKELDFSNFRFSSSHFVVFLHPYTFESYQNCINFSNTDDLLLRITMIATRFRKISIRIDAADQNTTVFTLLPDVVATFNLENKDPKQVPLDVSIHFEFCSYNASPSYFRFIIGLADKANTLYHGTIRNLYLSDSLVNGTSEICWDNLEYIQHLLTISSFKYELGIFLEQIYFCDTSDHYRIPDYVPQILQTVKNVGFWLSFSIKYFKADDMVILVTSVFEKCKTKLRHFNENVTFSIQTTWAYEDNHNIEEAKRLVMYWIQMNNWAIKNNVTMEMFEAFDVLSVGDDYYGGWWQPDLNKTKYNATSCGFYEKAILFQKSYPTNSTGIHQAVEKSDVGYTVGIPSLAVVTFLGFAMLYKYFRSAKSKPLTRKDISEFHNGASRSSEDSDHTKVYSRAYNHQLELSNKSFKIDWTTKLGSGAFAFVYQGIVLNCLRSKEEEAYVAVKTTHKHSSTIAIKGLMSEIKVLSYIGEHENIVGMFGAYTRELNKGKVYVFLELCALGSLEKHLRENIPRVNATEIADLFLNETVYTELGEIQESNQIHFVTNSIVRCQNSSTNTLSNCTENKLTYLNTNSTDFHRWSCEIANGMEYLASKNVVHADLATRNVLLTQDKTTKISDFGLSRRLYEYGNYVRTQQEPLPWKWMAPESLRRMEFNEKTDVWAFGVTLWEIYSIGDVPYEGLSWSPSFSSQLTSGLRLEEPLCNENEMYSTMLKCWNVDPTKRPTFSKLKEILTSKSQQLSVNLYCSNQNESDGAEGISGSWNA